MDDDTGREIYNGMVDYATRLRLFLIHISEEANESIYKLKSIFEYTYILYI